MAFVHSPFSFRFLDPILDFNKLDVGFKEAGCRMSYVGLLQVGCEVFTSRMSDFNMSDVGFTSRMSDFDKSDVGFLQVGCRIFTTESDVGCRILPTRMSDFYKSDVECRIFKVGCRMAPISFRI